MNSITARQLKDFLTFIASDELEGRDTPSRGLDTAAKYIAQHLSSWGIKPAGGEGTYFQRFPLRHSKLDPAGTRLEINGQAFNYGEDFLASLNPANFAGSGIVFAGNGWVIKSKNIDPYAGLDIKDQVVVVVNSLPKGVNVSRPERTCRAGLVIAAALRPDARCEGGDRVLQLYGSLR